MRDMRDISDMRRAIEIAAPAIASPQVSHAPAAPHAAPTAVTAGRASRSGGVRRASEIASPAIASPQVSAAPVAPHAAIFPLHGDLS